MLQHLRHLELDLQRLEVRRDRARLDELLHESFVEFGRSGKRYDKASTLDDLPSDPAPMVMWSQDFELVELADDVALLTYRSASVDEDGNLFRFSLRSSVWQRTARGWQMRFHQGTPTEPFAKDVAKQ
ncbi:MAG TPA: DUF4440 domain-containing protein [Anaerolineae bacterium]|nr:DUF4440 domain-containing protein [Anaerolineae bacterium]